jgi:hypothetical protein
MWLCAWGGGGVRVDGCECVLGDGAWGKGGWVSGGWVCVDGGWEL